MGRKGVRVLIGVTVVLLLLVAGLMIGRAVGRHGPVAGADPSQPGTVSVASTPSATRAALSTTTKARTSGQTVTATVTASRSVPSPRPTSCIIRWDFAPDTTQLPRSTCDGPTHVSAAGVYGFAHSERGAALAAINITALLSPSMGETTWRAAIAENTVGDQAGVLAEHLKDAAGGQPSPPAQKAVAYYWQGQMNPDKSQAVILWAVKRSDGLVVGTTSVVVWSGGDWKLSLPGAAMQHVPTPTGWNTLTVGSEG